MDDTTQTVETANPQAPSNEPSTTTAPATVNNSADVEAAKKEALREMARANQLANELEKLKADKAAKDAKQLEENQQFKELWEKEKAEKETLISERERAEQEAALKAETDSLLKNYSPAAKEIAQTTGLALTDDSDEAKAELKSKLDAIQSKVTGPGAKVEANNPAPTVPVPGAEKAQAVEVLKGDMDRKSREAATHTLLKDNPALKQMRAIAGIAEPTE